MTGSPVIGFGVSSTASVWSHMLPPSELAARRMTLLPSESRMCACIMETQTQTERGRGMKGCDRGHKGYLYLNLVNPQLEQTIRVPASQLLHDTHAHTPRDRER